MTTEKGLSLEIDSDHRIGVNDVIDMLKGLRNDTVIQIVKTPAISQKYRVKQNNKLIVAKDVINESPKVKGNTDLPQIRELNEIASLLRSMDNQSNQTGS